MQVFIHTPSVSWTFLIFKALKIKLKKVFELMVENNSKNYIFWEFVK
jgi:hypothetical protein